VAALAALWEVDHSKEEEPGPGPGQQKRLLEGVS
jgi:hypothetical protein